MVLTLNEVSDGREDIGMATATGDDSDDGTGNDSVKWLLLNRFSDSMSIGFFDKGVASPFGFLEYTSGKKKKGKKRFYFLSNRSSVNLCTKLTYPVWMKLAR